MAEKNVMIEDLGEGNFREIPSTAPAVETRRVFTDPDRPTAAEAITMGWAVGTMIWNSQHNVANWLGYSGSTPTWFAPVGPTGAAGATGPTGPRGATGPTGP